MGAIEIAGTWRTTASREAVWDVVVDLGTWPRWWPAIDDVELLAGSRQRPESARLTFGTPAPLRPLRVTLAVTGHHPRERLDVTTVEGPVRGVGRLVLRDEEGACATDFALRLEVRSRLFRPIERLLRQALQAGGRERLRKAGDDLARLAGGAPAGHEL